MQYIVLLSSYLSIIFLFLFLALRLRPKTPLKQCFKVFGVFGFMIQYLNIHTCSIHHTSYIHHDSTLCLCTYIHVRYDAMYQQGARKGLTGWPRRHPLKGEGPGEAGRRSHQGEKIIAGRPGSAGERREGAGIK